MNPYFILGAVGALLACFIAGGATGWHEKAIRVSALLEAQQAADQQTCAKAQQITKEAQNALQKDHDDIAAKLAALKLRHPGTCVPVPGKTQLPASGGKHAGQDGAGVSTDWLRDYAAESETYRASLVICEKVLDDERADR